MFNKQNAEFANPVVFMCIVKPLSDMKLFDNNKFICSEWMQIHLHPEPASDVPLIHVLVHLLNCF